MNGERDSFRHPQLPVTPDELAVAASAAVAAGADAVHLHPKNPDGTDSLEPRRVSAAVVAVRAAVPDWVSVGVTTGAWAAPDPRRRVELISQWQVLPDFASVNWHEAGADQVAAALRERGVGIEAGLFSGTDAVQRFRASGQTDRVLRVLAEVVDEDPVSAPDTALALLEELGKTDAPVLLHGVEGGAWPVLRVAARSGLAIRVGLEDMLKLPDGRDATDNAALVIAACGVISAESVLKKLSSNPMSCRWADEVQRQLLALGVRADGRAWPGARRGPRFSATGHRSSAGVSRAVRSHSIRSGNREPP